MLLVFIILNPNKNMRGGPHDDIKKQMHKREGTPFEREVQGGPSLSSCAFLLMHKKLSVQWGDPPPLYNFKGVVIFQVDGFWYRVGFLSS